METNLQDLTCFGMPLHFERYVTNGRRWVAKPIPHVAVELTIDFADQWRAELWLSDGDGIYNKTNETRPFMRPRDALDEIERIWRPRAVALTQALTAERRIKERTDGDRNDSGREGQPGTG